MTLPPNRKLAVLLHADIVESTALVRRDEGLAHQRMQGAFQSFSTVIADHSGTTHEIRGDALVAEFSKVSDAVTAALEFQHNHAAHSESFTDGLAPMLRIGIAMGEVIIADNTVTGEGIVLAQRIEQLAESGGVCLQGAAYETLPKRLPFSFSNLGDQQLKGFDEPVRVYRVSDTDNEKGFPRTVGKPVPPTTPDLPSKPSVAVLPFDNMSSDPEQAFLRMVLQKISSLNCRNFAQFLSSPETRLFQLSKTISQLRKLASILVYVMLLRAVFAEQQTVFGLPPS